MEAAENPVTEIKRLQRCINDLISVLALPAIWTGGEPSQIAGTLGETLQSMLDLDLVYVRLKNPGGEAPIEIVRFAPSQKVTAKPQEIGKDLFEFLGNDPKKWPPVVRKTFGHGSLLIVPMRIGLLDEIGLIVTGSQRADFPRQTETILLSVAVNQAAIRLQEARLLREQRLAAAELDQRVAQQTTELASANEELKMEVAERRLAVEKLRLEEAELKRSEARNAAILSSALDCIVTIDHESRITEFNPAAERTFGYRREQVMGRQLTDVIIPPTFREQHRRGFTRYLSTGEEQVLGRRLELTAVRQDGSEFPVELAITRIPLEGPPSFTGYLRDITKRKQSEETLREAHALLARNEERWRSVFENSAVGVALADLNGRFIAANPVYQRMLGYTEEELQKLSFRDITHENHLEDNQVLMGELLGGKRRQFQIEKQYRCRSGSLVWVRNNVSLVSGTERVPGFLMALSEDIMERKRAEEELQRSEALLSEAQHLSSTGSFSWRVSTDAITWSKQTHRIFEIDQALPITFELAISRIHPEDISAFQELLGRARTGSNDLDYEFRLLLPNSSVKCLHLVAHAIRDPDGQLEYVGAIQDVTESRMSEQALGKARSEIAHMSRAVSLGALTASIAHEVNQPIGAVVANANACLRWLDRQPPELAKAKESVRQIILDATRGSEVISGIRAFLRKEQPRSKRLNINEIIQEMIMLLRSELREVTAHTHLADNLPPVVADQVQLQQVLLNLIMNAVEAMTSVSDRPRLLQIETKRYTGQTVVVTVQDSGVGLNDNQMQKLFDPFYTTKAQGLGMGLSICRMIVERFGGRLWAEANQGAGATFKFSLPSEVVEHV